MRQTFLTLFIPLCAIIMAESARAYDFEEGEIRGGVGLHRSYMDPRQSPLREPSIPVGGRWGGFVGAQAGLTDRLVADLMIRIGEIEFSGRDAAGQLVVEKSDRIHVPLLMRWWLADFLSVGVGFYGSYRMGGVETVLASPQTSPQSKTSAADVGEHGIETALGVNWPKQIYGYGLHLEWRHSYSLTPRENEVRNWDGLVIGVFRNI